jgi:hypothetical protein
MFRPNLAILRQVFACWNCYTVIVHKLKYFIVITFCHLLIKKDLLEVLTHDYLHYFLLMVSVFPVLCNTLMTNDFCYC